jgi:EAL domain-containing protein (putative c-di-GMP-specific phosphodiesterase class I)
VAEGIELEAQWHQLHREGCHLGQGYLFARPMHEVDAEALVADLVALHRGSTAADDPTP